MKGSQLIKRTFGCTCVLAALSLGGLFDTHAISRTYHVDVVRGSDAFPGSEMEPFKSIAAASRVAAPGDTVLIREGVYHEQIVGGASGTVTGPITYEGVDQDKVIMRGSVRVQDWMRKGNVWEKRGLSPITDVCAFVMVDEKLMLKRVPLPDNMPEGSFCLSRNGTYTIRLAKDADPNKDHMVEVYELDCAFNAGNRWNGTAKKWITLRRMTLEKYGGSAISADKQHPGDNSHWELDRITVQYNYAEGVFHCLDDWKVHDSRFVRNRCHGCQIDGARVIFTRNYCAENEWFGAHEDGGCGLLIGPDASAHSCVVRDNIFQSNGSRKGYGCGIYLEGRSRDNLVENNLILRSTATGIGFYGSSHNRVLNNVVAGIGVNSDYDAPAAFVVGRSYEGAPTQSVGNLVAHNTIWDCPAVIRIMEPANTVAKSDVNRFINNVFARCSYAAPDSSVLSMDGNAWYECPSEVRASREIFRKRHRGREHFGERAVIVTDPGLVNPDGGDFRLKPGSPLIAAGVPLPEVHSNRQGDAHGGIGGNPDIGVYMYWDPGRLPRVP